MKPINRLESGCDPISSNCVIWQGPDISCLSLCRGDTVSDVVATLAEEFCTLTEIFDISEYDLSCLNLLECGPTDFKELIQLIIEKLCDLYDITDAIDSTGTVSSQTLSTEVTINPLFYYENPQGDTVTTMTFANYIIAVANKVATLASSISTINSTLDLFDGRITDLENAPAPTLTLPSITPQSISDVSMTLDDLAEELEKQFTLLRNATGYPTAIVSAMNSACRGLNESAQLGGDGKMKTIDGWFLTPATLAQSFSNLWKTVCDLRNAVMYIKENCCYVDCEDIHMTVRAEILTTTKIRLWFEGTIPGNFFDAPEGSQITMIDSAGSGPQVIAGIAIKSLYYNTSTYYDIELGPINGANDITVTVHYHFYDPVTGMGCNGIVTTTALGTETCPDLTLVPDYTGIDFTFPWTGTTPKAFIVELYDVATDTLKQSINITVNTALGSGSFSGLTEGTDYKVRLLIDGVPCEFENVTTLEYPCIAPTMLTPAIDYTNPEGDTDGNTIATWQVVYDAYHP